MNELSEIDESIKTLSQEIGTVLIEAQKSIDKNLSGLFYQLESFFKLIGWSKALEILLNHQIMMTERITKDLEDRILESEDVPKLIEEYYTDDNKSRLNIVIQRCKEAPQMEKHQELFKQILSAYQIESYHLACMGLFAIADELLTMLTGVYRPKDNKRLKKIEENIDYITPLSEFDFNLWSAYLSLSKEDSSFYKFQPFDQEEPATLNRHWTMHGRSARKYEQIDFIRVLLWIDALLRLKDYSSHKGEQECPTSIS